MSFRWANQGTMYRATFPSADPAALARVMGYIESMVPGARSRSTPGKPDCIDVGISGVELVHAWCLSEGLTPHWTWRAPPPVPWRLRESELRPEAAGEAAEVFGVWQDMQGRRVAWMDQPLPLTHGLRIGDEWAGQIMRLPEGVWAWTAAGEIGTCISPVVAQAQALRALAAAGKIRRPPGPYTLLHFQTGAVDAARAAFAKGYRQLIVNMFCGAGKTGATVHLLTHLEGDILIVGPGRARPAWEDDIRALTTARPFVLYPESERTDADLTLPEYLDGCHGLPTVKGLRSEWSRVAIVWGAGAEDEVVRRHVRRQVARVGRAVVEVEGGGRVPPDAQAVLAVGGRFDGTQIPAKTKILPTPVPTPQRAWVIIGDELLADMLGQITQAGYQPTILVFDEIHTHGDSHIWRYTAREPGGACPGCGAAAGVPGNSPETTRAPDPCKTGCPGGLMEMRLTKGAQRKRAQAGEEDAGGWAWTSTKGVTPRILQAAAAQVISQLPSLRIWLGVTATLPDMGQQEKMHAPLHLLAPFHWGKARDFETRYGGRQLVLCGDGKERFKCTGNTCVDELRGRVAPFLYRVPFEVSHASIRKLRVQVQRIPRSAQSRSARRGAVEAEPIRGKKSADARAREGKVMLGLAAIRRPTLAEIGSVLDAGGKVVHFTTRQSEVTEVENALRRSWERHGVLVVRADGSVPPRERDALKAQWMAWQGPAVLTATGYAWNTSSNGLQLAHAFVIQGLPDNPVDLLQWIGRGPRHGSLCDVVRILVGKGTVFGEVADRLEVRLGGLGDLFDPAMAQEVRGKIAALGSIDDILDDIVADVSGRGLPTAVDPSGSASGSDLDLPFPR